MIVEAENQDCNELNDPNPFRLPYNYNVKVNSLIKRLETIGPGRQNTFAVETNVILKKLCL